MLYDTQISFRASARTRSYYVYDYMFMYNSVYYRYPSLRASVHTRTFRIRIIRNRIFTPSPITCTGTLSRIPRLNPLSYNVIALFRTIAHVRSRNIAAILRAKNTFWYLHIFKRSFRVSTCHHVRYSTTGYFRTSGISDSRTPLRRSSHS